jgi:hypothetical protein
MTTLLRVNLVTGSVVAFVVVVALVRRDLLQIKYALIWLCASAALVLWAVVPRIVTGLTRAMGIALESNAIFLIMIMFCTAVLLMVSISISRDNLRIKRLAHEIALLKAELMRLSHGRKNE